MSDLILWVIFPATLLPMDDLDNGEGGEKVDENEKDNIFSYFRINQMCHGLIKTKKTIL